MKYTTHTYPIQSLSTGGQHSICAHVFEGDTPGPHVYLQANLHGPEVFGTALLVSLIQELKQKKHMVGKITLVPCANPMGVSCVAYNAMVGRWNMADGTNWNRIFPKDIVWENHLQEKEYFETQLEKDNVSIQDKFAATLRLLSLGADYIVDIHSTGTKNTHHLFCREDMSEVFAHLGAHIHLLSKDDVCEETFEESHVYPFRKHLAYKEIPKACTWEVSGGSAIDVHLLQERLKQLNEWLGSVWDGGHKSATQPQKLYHFTNLTSPIAGYYSWIGKLGGQIEKGEVYAHVFSPHTAEIQKVKAEFPFTLISTYGVGAVSQGEQIAWIGW